MKYLLIWINRHGSIYNEFVYGDYIASIRRKCIALMKDNTRDGEGALVTDKHEDLVGRILLIDGKWYYKTPSGKPFRISVATGERIKD